MSSTRVLNLNADQVDGFDASDLAIRLGNVVTVASSGGDFTSIQAALDSITDSNIFNPYLVRVGPGDYEEEIVLKSDVTLRGAGIEATEISFTDPANPAVVTAGDNATIRDLTILCRARSEAGCTAVYVPGDPFPGVSGFKLQRVEILSGKIDLRDQGTVRGVWSKGGGVELHSVGVTVFDGDTAYGVSSEGSDSIIDLHNVEIEIVRARSSATGLKLEGNLSRSRILHDLRVLASGSGTNIALQLVSTIGLDRITNSEFRAQGPSSADAFGAILEDEDDIVFDRCLIEASDSFTTLGSIGLLTQGSSTPVVHLRHSTVIGQSATVFTSSGVEFRAAHTHFEGGPVAGGGTETCAFSTDENYTGSASGCP